MELQKPPIAQRESKSATILYRGPLERSRLVFLINAFKRVEKELRFFWLFPGESDEEKRAQFKEFMESCGIEQYHLIDGRVGKLLALRQH